MSPGDLREGTLTFTVCVMWTGIGQGYGIGYDYGWAWHWRRIGDYGIWKNDDKHELYDKAVHGNQ